ncbi:MAG: D-tyrosyl-tRNA(Tyr) deacylase [Deltaproteobacteria bacterium]|nr:MAG: D-tyrosyl-tRNA(Tyr) deacylase [Deltaproteobacteria bacterium]
MRAVVQRVSRASVTVKGEVVGEIGAGLLVLLAVAPGDGPDQVAWLARKVAGLRIFADDAGRMNRSLLEIGGAALVVSQFTLYGDCRRGRRPSFVGAAEPALAERLYEEFCSALVEQGVGTVARGRFAAHMQVALTNDGPVTLVIDTPG